MQSTPRILVEPTGSGTVLATGDCACADAGAAVRWSRPATLPERDTRLFCVPGLLSLPLDAEHSVVMDRLSDSGVAVVNAPVKQVLNACGSGASLRDFPGQLEQQAVEHLLQLGFLADSRSDGSGQPAAATTLVAWLHVTDRCNLACDYCYLPKNGQAMTAEVGRQAVEAVFRSAQRHGFRAVKLKYAGGEASLNFARILEMHDHAATLSQASGLALEGVILTNGVGLSARMMTETRTRGIGLMVSLDGIGDAHDRQRRFPNGQGSFAMVARTIDRMVNMGCRPQISLTITERNVGDVAETVTWVLDRGLPFSLNFFRDNDCSATYRDLQLREERLIREMRRAYAVVEERLPAFSLIGALLDRTHLAGRHSRPCGVGHSYLAINEIGGIAQCQTQLDQEVAHVSAEDPLALVRAADRGVINLSVDEKPGCRVCDWRYFCAGGCPIETFRATGRWDVQSPLCHVYQALFPEVLRLEGLRLLRHGSVYDPRQFVVSSSDPGLTL